jgi:hypothetical protein
MAVGELDGSFVKINVFEGARRVAAIFLAVWFFGWVGYGFVERTDETHLHYVISRPGATAKKTEESCGGWHFLSLSHEGSRSVRPYLCFGTIPTESRVEMTSSGLKVISYLVPYATDAKGGFLADTPTARM